MADEGGAAHAVDDKEKRRRKQANRMAKILGKVWALKGSEAFQEEKHATSKEGHVLDLTTIGQKIDDNKYRLGRHGWEDFSRDLGGVYNRHIQRKTKHAKTASNHMRNIKDMLGHKDQSLADLAKDFVPSEVPIGSRKRKASEDPMDSRISRKKSSASRSSNDKAAESGEADLSLKEREVKAMEALASFVEENGGAREQVAGFRSRVTRKPSDRRYDINFYNEQGRRFRSMLEVGRFLNLIKSDKPPKRKASFRKKPKTSREKEAEKKKLRKDLEKLRKAHQRAVKALDDFANDRKESRYPMEDIELMKEEQKSGKHVVTPSTCAAARVPDIRGFPGMPQYCIPDLLMTWDFLCTFHKTLDLEPISLDDFASALTYKPPDLGHMKGDDIQAPPVYLAEAHLGLLKLLVSDRQSDEWWWAILETQESENPDAKLQIPLEEKEDPNMAVVKVDMLALLTEVEDPLITNSWLTSLEDVRNINTTDSEGLEKAVKPALSVVANKWVSAYLRKALKLLKRKDVTSTKRALIWLVDRVKEARPDLFNRSVRESRMVEIRAKVVAEAQQQMDKLSASAPTVKEEDLVSDVESDDDDSDSSDDEEDRSTERKDGESSDVQTKTEGKDESEQPASAIPPRPPPTLVDLLLPPFKPTKNSEFLNAFTWPQLSGAATWRILHRFKRLRSEVDDSLRAVNELLPQLTVSQRREREASSTSRVFTECCASIDGVDPAETAVEHLCSGGDYLELTPVQRLCILRVMIEAAYDTRRVYEVVDGNFQQRINASKTLDAEERKARREAKEKAAAAEAAAREQLAAEARNKFLEEKRAEILKLNERSNEYTDEFMESITDEDIIELDEDIKADYAALPPPESFSKIEVNKMVAKLEEEAAFETHSLRVLTMKQLIEQEDEELKAMEEQLKSIGGDNADSFDSSMDRETSRMIDRLKKNIDKAKDAAVTLPELREVAILILRDAMADGTIKVLKSALREAKLAKLTGEDETTGGVWALDLMRDAALELEKAKQHKRVADARKELVAKRNKCFIRNEAIGRDRFRNRFWHFDRDEHSHFWAEADYVLKGDVAENQESSAGFLDLGADSESLFIGAKDEEEDLKGRDMSDNFSRFCRQEYHSSGSKPCLAKRSWGCHATEKSLRTLIKDLDSRGVREQELKSKMKEALEENVGSGEKQETSTKEQEEADKKNILTSGDEEAFKSAKDAEREAPRDGISMEILDKLVSVMGANVRVRVVPEDAKDPTVARYEIGKITGFKRHTETVMVENDNSDDDYDAGTDEKSKQVDIHEWQASTDRGHTYWLSDSELTDSLCRYEKWKTDDKAYFENDAAFLSYRNSLGRHCGRAAEAPYSSSPMVFARMMVKKEQELYSKLKIRYYDNNWGGKSGARAVWTNSMKDYTFDLHSARDGLLTLENAFYGLMDGIPDAEGNEKPSGKDILENPVTRDDIELESIDSKNITGLWNSPESRAVFYEIVNNCKTTGVLALAFDLMCRNTTAFLRAHKLLNVKTEADFLPAATRSTRRMNAWQQANQDAGW